jgi:parvulin-like peptidyl-prolyl isomerase
LEQVVQQLKDGELSDIIAVESGFIVVRRLKHNPATTLTLDEVRQQITAQLQQAAANQAWETYYQARLQEYKPSLNMALLENADTSDSAPVFRYADQVITYGEVKPDLNRFRALPAEKFNEQLNLLFKNRMLAYTARQQGIDQTPEYAQARSTLLTEIIYQRVQADLTTALSSQETADEGESRAFYEANKESFAIEAETKIKVLRIPIPMQPESDSELMRKAAAFKTAQALRQRLSEGQDMDALMRETNGDWDGDMDFAPFGPRGRLIDTAVEELKVGETSQPVEFKGGFYIVRVVDEHPPRPRSFEEVKPKADEYLKITQARKKMAAMREEQLEAAGFMLDPAGFELVLNALR